MTKNDKVLGEDDPVKTA